MLDVLLTPLGQSETKIRSLENRLFFKRWLRHPVRLGTFAPISARLANGAAQQISVALADSLQHSTSGEPAKVIEIGAGTGRLTRALLAHGIRHLKAVELDGELCTFLRRTSPSVEAIEGNAMDLENLIPPSWVGQVSAIVSVIPLMYLPVEVREGIINACLKVLKPDGEIFHVTYSPKSPLTSLNSSLKGRRVLEKWWNFPPGFMWHYTRSDLLHSREA